MEVSRSGAFVVAAVGRHVRVVNVDFAPSLHVAIVHPPIGNVSWV